MFTLSQLKTVETAVDLVTSTKSTDAIQKYVSMGSGGPDNLIIYLVIFFSIFLIIPITYIIIGAVLKKQFNNQGIHQVDNSVTHNLIREAINLLVASQTKVDSLVDGINRSITHAQLVLILKENIIRNKLELMLFAMDMSEGVSNKNKEVVITKTTEFINRLVINTNFIFGKFTCDETDTSPEVFVKKNIRVKDYINHIDKFLYTHKSVKDLNDNLQCQLEDILQQVDNIKLKK